VKGGLKPYVFRKRRLTILELVFDSAMIEGKFGSGRHEGPPRARSVSLEPGPLFSDKRDNCQRYERFCAEVAVRHWGTLLITCSWEFGMIILGRSSLHRREEFGTLRRIFSDSLSPYCSTGWKSTHLPQMVCQQECGFGGLWGSLWRT